MTMGTKIVFIITLIVSIIVPFGYYLLGEKSRKRYKRAIGTNAFFFFGAFAIASIMLLGGPNVQAAEAVTAGCDRYGTFLYRRRNCGCQRSQRSVRCDQ